MTNNIAAYKGIATKVAGAGESAVGNVATEGEIAARNRELQMPPHELLRYPFTFFFIYK